MSGAPGGRGCDSGRAAEGGKQVAGQVMPGAIAQADQLAARLFQLLFS